MRDELQMQPFAVTLDCRGGTSGGCGLLLPLGCGLLPLLHVVSK